MKELPVYHASSYKLFQGKKCLEDHSRPADAIRAMLIIKAHEKRNGRSGEDVSISPPVSCHLEDIYPALPTWAEEALGKEYLESLMRPLPRGYCKCGSTKYKRGHMPQDHAGWQP